MLFEKTKNLANRYSFTKKVNNSEKTTKYIEDIVFFWNPKGKPHKCSIKTYWITWEKAIVVATNLGYKHNQKLRNITEEIINFINEKYKLSPNKTMLIEYYPENCISNKEMYVHILLTNYGFIRYVIEKKRLAALIETADL